jgi:hypothetical protein
MTQNSEIPESMYISRTTWIMGFSPTGRSSFGMLVVRGLSRVPKPATGMTAFVTSSDTIGLLPYYIPEKPVLWAGILYPTARLFGDLESNHVFMARPRGGAIHH